MIKKSFVKGFLCSAAVIAGLVLAKPVISHAEDLPKADPSKGITVDSETNEINLNGNSIIIRESANSTETTPLTNFYIDKNRNGLVDEDEQMAEVNGSTDINMASIYGVKDEELDSPIRITIESGSQGSIRTVSGGKIVSSSTDEAAITLDIKGGNISYFSGAENSTVSSEGDTAIYCIQTGGAVSGQLLLASNSSVTAKGNTKGVLDADINSGNIGVFMGISTCDINGTENTSAIDISVTNDAYISTFVMGNSSYNANKYSNIIGNVIFNVDGNRSDEDSTNSYTIGNINGITNPKIKGSCSVTIKNANIGSINYLINTNLPAVDGEKQYSYVSGDINCKFISSVFSNISYLVNTAKTDGNLKLSLEEGAEITYTCYLATNSYLKGNVDISIDSLSFVGGFYGLNYSSIDGDYTAKMRYPSSSYYYSECISYSFTGAEHTVKGNVDITINGGKVSSVYGVLSAKVDGNVNIKVNGLEGYSLYGLYSGSLVKGDFSMVVPDDAYFNMTSSVYGAGNSCVEGKFTFDISNDATSNNGYYYGAYYSTVGKTADINIRGGSFSSIYAYYGNYSSSNSNTNPNYIGGDAKISISNVNAYNIYGTEYMDFRGNLDINIKSADRVNNSYGYLYGCYYSRVAKKLSVNVTDSLQSGIYGVYESRVAFSDDTSIEQPVCNVDINNCITTDYLYLLDYSKFNGDVVANSYKNISRYFYGCYSSDVTGNLTFKSSYENDKAITDADNNPIVDSYPNAGSEEYRAVSYGNINGSVDIDIDHCTYRYPYIIYYMNCSDKGGTVDITDCNFGVAGKAGYMDLVCMSSSASEVNAKYTVNIKNTDFSKADSFVIRNCMLKGSYAETAIDDKTVFTEKYALIANYNSTGFAKITYKNDLYLGGEATLTEDISAENVYLGNYALNCYGSGYFTIPEGVTVSATKNIYIPKCSNILLYGKLSGNVTKPETYVDESNETVIDYGNIFYEGGTVDGTITMMDEYYPINYVYNTMGCSITPDYSNGSTYSYNSKIYGKSGSAVSTKLNIYTGYKFVSAAWCGADEEYSDMAAEETTFSYDMPATPVTVKFEVIGIQIVLGKTEADPVAKLNQEYTDESPLYNLNKITIANDAKVGDVVFELADGNSLPEGLVLEDGLIYGTPNKAYEDGKKVVIKVTGKNKTTANLSLNIIVSSGDATQPEQEGRIFVDEESKVIDLLGNSVVIDSYEKDEEAFIGIFIDDNRDGVADRSVPVYYGDLSEYEIYGLKDADINRPISIIVNNGAVKKINGVARGTVSTPSEDAIIIEINGGTVDSVAAIVGDATINGYIRIENKANTLTNTTVTLDNSNYTGYYRNIAGNVTITGSYTAKKEINVTSISNTSIPSTTGTPEIVFEKPVVIDGGTWVTNTNSTVVFKDTFKGSSHFNTYGSSSYTFEKGFTINGNLYINSDCDVVCQAESSAANITLYNHGSIQIEAKLTCKSFITRNYCNVFILENGELYTETTNIYSSSYIYHKGVFGYTNAITNSGYWYMMGGTFADGTDDSKLARKFYPVTFSTEFDKATVKANAGVMYVNEVAYMSPSVTNNSINYTVIPGYESYISINGGTPELMSSSPYVFTMEDKPTSILVEYVPTDIEVSKKYADPVIVVGTEYTTANPVYNLKSLNVYNDTTSYYGGEMKYSLKRGSTLPKGLSFEDGKIIGTPVATNGDGDTVSFVVTGKNGTTTVVDINIVIKESGYTETDINDIATVYGSSITLNGASVVIIADPEDSTKSGIYMDANHDGIADNNHSLIINDEYTYNLVNYTIYGYKSSTDAYEGDISIYLISGTVGYIYGAVGNNSQLAEVNGNVDIFLKGGLCNSASALFYAKAKNTGFYVTGTTIRGSSLYGIYYSETENYNYEFSGTSQMTSSSSSAAIYASFVSNISNDVNAKVGLLDSSYQFYGSYTDFYGLYGENGSHRTTVGGDVNYVIDGYWYTKYRGLNFLTYYADIKGNLNVDWKDGSFGSRYADQTNSLNGGFTRETIVNDINIIVDENANISSGTLNIAVGGTVNNMYCYVPNKSNISISTIYSINSSYATELTGYSYVDKKGAVEIGGKYKSDKEIEATSITIKADADVTFNKDVKTSSLQINSGATVSIDKAVTLNTINAVHSYGTIVNNGTWNADSYVYLYADTKTTNNGELNFNYYTYIYGTLDNYGILTNIAASNRKLIVYDKGIIINREDATYNMGAIYLNTNSLLVNYGVLNQTWSNYSIGSGKICTTVVPKMYYELSRYSIIYYNTYIDDDYPKYCVDSVTLGVANDSNMVSNVIEGDTNTYIKYDTTFYVQFGTIMDGITVDKVTFGSSNTVASTTDKIKYQGLLGCEPTVIKLSFANTNTDIDSITIDKESDEVTDLQVGKATYASSPAYDLTKLVVSNDDESLTDAYVTYQVSVDSKLPAGLVLKNGKIYGTPTTATEEANEVKIIVKGKNQTYTTFTLTFTKVAKGIPSFSKPSSRRANAGDTLANVSLPYSSIGVYSWPDSSLSVGDVTEEGTEFDIIFTPYDTANYDWSAIDSSVGTFEDGVVKTKILIKIRKLVPTYEVPEGITAVYGDKLADIEIPKAEAGTFKWMNGNAVVNGVGEQKFYATYVPDESGIYENVDYIEIIVNVSPKKASYESALETVYAVEGMTLADIILPDVDGGKYQWITQPTTVVEVGKQYKVGYKPDDVVNYDWSDNTGWSSAYKAIIFTVTVDVEHVHSYGEEWIYDDDNHWHECVCGDKEEAVPHTWDEGVITTKPTETAEGVRTYTCTVCKATKVESVPRIVSTVIDITKPESKLTVGGITNMNYTGKAITMSALVVKSGTKTLVNGKDYTVTYANNVKVGKATISIIGKGSYKGTITKSFNITLSKGKVYVVKNKKYKVTKVGTAGKGTVSLVGTTNKRTNKRFKKLVIGSTVSIGGVKYKITEIGNNAFKNYKNLKSVTIGANIRKIGKSAFYGCKNLKTVIIKSTKLTKKSVASNAFKKTNSKPTVKITKKKYNAYKKFLKSKGISKKARYVKTK